MSDKTLIKTIVHRVCKTEEIHNRYYSDGTVEGEIIPIVPDFVKQEAAVVESPKTPKKKSTNKTEVAPDGD